MRSSFLAEGRAPDFETPRRTGEGEIGDARRRAAEARLEAQRFGGLAQEIGRGLAEQALAGAVDQAQRARRRR